MSFVHSVNSFSRLHLFVFVHLMLPWTLGLVQIEQFITSAQCVHCTVGFPCSKKSPVVATGE